MSRNMVLLILIAAILMGIGSAYVFNSQQEKLNAALTGSSPAEVISKSPTPTPTPTLATPDFTESKSAHFVSSKPQNNEVFAVAPSEVRIRFNFTLGNKSTIKIAKDGQPLSVPDPSIGSDRLALLVPFSEGSGAYQVDYLACWLDDSCHPGSFGFIVK